MLNDVVFGELFEELTARRIPLLIKPSWPTVYSLLGEFPQLTVVAVGHGPHGAPILPAAGGEVSAFPYRYRRVSSRRRHRRVLQ